jgi:D-amino-acid dehydrogenase
VNVAVVGGGVVGLACAWYLRRGGATVVLLERDEAGAGASSGNTGWVTPVFSGPLPAPGVARQALRWAVSPVGAFAVRPRLDADFAAWCWRFWRSSGRDRHRAGLRAVLALNARTLGLYDELQADGVQFEAHDDGVLLLFLSERARDAELQTLEGVGRAGYRGSVVPLSGDATRELDPAIGDAVAGAIELPAERHVRPESLSAGLARALRDEGVEIRERCEVGGLARRGRAWRVQTRAPLDELEVDRVVVAAGAWTGALLAGLGTRIRQQPAKGYSVTFPRDGAAPRMPLYFSEARVSCSPFDDAVRLAGMLELGTFDLAIDRRRVGAIVASASTYLRAWSSTRPRVEWAGLRPLPADGLPVVGAVPGHDGLFVATGHGMLGVTLAPATGEALARLILSRDPVPELEPMRVERR